MTEPRRLFTDESSSALTRSLLEAGRARREPVEARERVWVGVAAGMAAGTTAGGIVALLSKSKLLLLGVFLGVGGAVALFAIHREDQVVAAAPAIVALPPATAVEPTPTVIPEPSASVVEAPPPAPVRARPAPTSSMREEAALLEEARVALASGDGELARSKLTESQKRFPKSRLEQERDALDIRITDASGDHDRANALVHRFVERYPDSPLRSSLESLVR